MELLACGLSVPDIVDIFTTEDGRQLLRWAAVSEIGERLWGECQAFATRDLSAHDIV